MLIQNSFYKLSLEDKTGCLKEFVNEKGKDFFWYSVHRSLYDLYLFDEKNNRITIQGRDFEKMDVEQSEEKTVLDYKTVGGYDINVIVTIRHPKDEPMTYWGIKVKNNSGLHLDKIDFPKVYVPNDLVATGKTGRIFSPMMEGVEITDASIRDRIYMCYRDIGYPACGWEGSYPGPTQMQFMAYYCDKGGLYFATHDKCCNPKSVEFVTSDGGIKLEFKHFPGTDDTTDFDLGYETVLGLFDGNWYDAAEIYRNFIEESGLIKIPKIKNNPDIPKWLKESPVVVCYPIRGEDDGHVHGRQEYYPYTRALPYVKALHDDLDSAILPVMMQWEGTAPWAPPYVWPPYGDYENLKEYVKGLHESGNYLGLYCSGIAWTQHSYLLEEYKKDEDFEKLNINDIAVRSPKQQLEYSFVCGCVGDRYDMCPSCEQTRQIATDEFDKILSGLDVDYVQFFDQNLGGGAYACYAKNHDHCFGPGRWISDSMLKLVDEMEKVIEKHGKKGKMLIGCEANAAEPYVNNFVFNDSRHNINYQIGQPVPAYNYVFHEYVCNFMGNQNSSYGITDFEKYTDNIFYRIAHSFAQGDVITVVFKDGGKLNWDWNTPWSVKDVDQKGVRAFIRLLNLWRKNAGKEALQYGRMIKPYEYDCGVYEEEIRFGGVHDYPSVESTCFKTEDGKIDQIFINYLGKPQKITLKLPKDGVLIKDFEGKTKSVVKKNGTVKIPARSMVMIEL